MHKILISLISILGATLTLSAQNFNYNFDATDSDAWADGDGLNSGAAILAQAPWVIDSVGGNLYASNTTANFNNAVFFTNAEDTFDVGETITLELSYKFADSTQINAATKMLRFGFKDAYTNGAPTVGMEINPTASDIRINAMNENVITVGAGDTQDGLFHTYTTALTKTAVTNTFELSINFDNGTATSYTVVNSALYAASRVFPVLNTQLGANKGGSLVDSFSSTVVPEPSAFAATFGIFALACVVARRKRNLA